MYVFTSIILVLILHKYIVTECFLSGVSRIECMNTSHYLPLKVNSSNL
jgi:hypothetical protein